MNDKTFRKICEDKLGFVCAETGIEFEPEAISYHHILPKGTFPRFRYYLPCMIPLSLPPHIKADTNPKGMKIYKELKAKKQALIQKYYQNN